MDTRMETEPIQNGRATIREVHTLVQDARDDIKEDIQESRRELSTKLDLMSQAFVAQASVNGATTVRMDRVEQEVAGIKRGLLALALTTIGAFVTAVTGYLAGRVHP